jgi:hypothetical protein
MLTITEALAEIATIDKRLPKKATEMTNYVARQDLARDPMEKSGGSAKFIREERQSHADLLARKIALRRAIAKANAETLVSVDGKERSVADWLVWKRECHAAEVQVLRNLLNGAQTARAHAQKNGVALVSVSEGRPEDIIVNVDEQGLVSELDALEEMAGKLDGLLSLKNAVTTLDI